MEFGTAISNTFPFSADQPEVSRALHALRLSDRPCLTCLQAADVDASFLADPFMIYAPAELQNKSSSRPSWAVKAHSSPALSTPPASAERD
eukprot:CAMPEP_0177638060 /NCGR_PEP_ID=MMETSP0447-20121125/5291_1 /TAXON_ID=0 /ORGANISM="Stygamoeba regulata, Strain BSH-02190019" /LENGTH=90 /DNA_ID=CAMNT_0019140005 /DNA_START=306 /DNA_END=576 /DNA_ORIENTATION=-